MGSIVHFFGDTDLRCQHNGLSEIAKKEKIDVGKLLPGEYVVYVNHARDRVKLFTSSNVIAYLRLKTGKIDLRTIQFIPKAFEGSGRIDYDKSLKEFVESSLVKKGKTGPLEAAREIEKVKKMKPVREMSEEDRRGLAGELVLSMEEDGIVPKKKKVILRKKGER